MSDRSSFRRCRASVRACLLAGFTLLVGVDATAEDAVLFRLFLASGESIATFGEYARVGDRVVFSMAVGVDLAEPRLQLVSMPAEVIDWVKTETYTEAARYERYVATNAESDFARMSADVASALNKIAGTPDPRARLEIAERAKATLVDWPRANYGYRAAEVRQIASLLDEVIAELRAATGASSFDLTLVASPLPPPQMPLLPPPSYREIAAQMVAVARLTDAPSERMSLLRSAAAFVEDLRVGLDPAALDWVPRTRQMVADAIEAETETEKQYARFTRNLLNRAISRAARADVRGVERVLGDLRKGDAQLGQKRPDAVSALIVAVQQKLDAARRLRLARDAWTAREPALRKYQRASTSAILPIQKLNSLLLDIKGLAGPEPSALARLDQAVAHATLALSALQPPETLRAVHGELTGALNFAASAVRLRRRAIASGNLREAWDASSAAAACIMLLERARSELTEAVQPPRL